jgi:hypothetical protein
MNWKKIIAVLLAFGMCLSNGLPHTLKKKPSPLILKGKKVGILSVAKTSTGKAKELFALAQTEDQKKAVLKAWLRNTMKERGYTPKEYQQVKYIWSKESAFNWTAEGPGSKPALGIAQIKYSKGWQKWNRDPFKQMEQGLRYIDSRYDSVEHAYKTKKKTGVY